MPIADADVWGLASTQAPQARAGSCSNKEAKWSPMETYEANEWQDVHSAPKWRFTTLFLSAYMWLDQRLRHVGACAASYKLNSLILTRLLGEFYWPSSSNHTKASTGNFSRFAATRTTLPSWMSFPFTGRKDLGSRNPNALRTCLHGNERYATSSPAFKQCLALLRYLNSNSALHLLRVTLVPLFSSSPASVFLTCVCCLFEFLCDFTFLCRQGARYREEETLGRCGRAKENCSRSPVPSAPGPSIQDKRLKRVAEVDEVTPSEDEDTCSGLVFRRKRKADAAILCHRTQMVKPLPTGSALPAPLLLATSWWKKVGGECLRRWPVGSLYRSVYRDGKAGQAMRAGPQPVGKKRGAG